MSKTFNLRNQIDVRKKCANIDALYGPYNSLEEAQSALTGRETVGRTVGIIQNDEIVEFWFKTQPKLNNKWELEKKQESTSLTIIVSGSDELTYEEGESPNIKFIVKGNVPINKAILYVVNNNVETIVKEYNTIGKNYENTIVIPNLTVSGTYKYRIKVLDTMGNYAMSIDEQNYIEYNIKYGGISTTFNFTQLDSILVKNYSSVANQYFMMNISLRDETFTINKVYLSDIHDPHTNNINLELIPYIDKNTESNVYTGNNYYFLPDKEILQQFNGKICSIVITYKENNVDRQKVQDIFTLLDISSLTLVSENDNNIYYTNIPSYYIFKLQTGVEDISARLTPGANSDFDFEIATVYAYKRYTLRVFPKDIIKNNAKIVINYSFTYNNQIYSGVIEKQIGNIYELGNQSFYEPSLNGAITLNKLINANSSDYDNIDNGQYYKVIKTPITNISDNCHSSSFIIDLYCKLNQQNDKSKKVLSISYGGVEYGYINEDEISCAGISNNLITDMPLNEWVQIGIGINLEETINRNHENIIAKYHAIYINGMVVKNVLIDDKNVHNLEYDALKNLTIIVQNNLLVQKCFVYYNNVGTNAIYPNTDHEDTIIYNNFKSHKLSFSEPENLPVLKLLKITDDERNSQLFKAINDYKYEKDDDCIKYLTNFGKIGLTKSTTMAEYDNSYESYDYNPETTYDITQLTRDASLFRQSVDIKKPAQKEYAVLCDAQWLVNDVNILDGVIVEVHTQGTSTLVYSVPNFKMTFWKFDNENHIQHYNPEFIQKEGTNEYYDEYVYTAKADYMDSSHLNNTPTCNYFNKLIRTLVDSNQIQGSPAAKSGLLDAIIGFPIIMEICDNGGDFSSNTIFTNIGSFMLNIDKTGRSLGFEINNEENPQEPLTCISFEGTSNDNEHGAAGRFDIPTGTTLKNYVLPDGTVDEVEIKADYNRAKDAITLKKALSDLVDDGTGTDIMVQNLPYVKWCKFLSDGLEYRYPDTDIYKEKSSALSKVMKVEHFIKFYKMWSWVNTSDQLSTEDYKAGFAEHFDVDYCKLYFIQLMIFAQTDNLGKNAMFDCWDGQHWYPRPYDLDSECGLDNNGNDNIATFVEIRPEFSLNYDPNFTEEQLVENKLKENSTITYGSQTYDRYHFSSNRSKLWITFYKNFKTEIETFYRLLKDQANYSAESIIQHCQAMLIDKLGINQYNKDFANKYLANSDQKLAYGNRWYKFKKWITKRFAFCDSYFNAYQNATYDTTSQFMYTVKIDSPQYVSQQYQDSRITRFVLDQTTFNAGSGAATKITLLANQGSVFETDLFKYVTFANGDAAFNNILSLDVSGNKNIGFNNISSVVGNELNNLKYLNISNSYVQSLNVPINVKKLDAENVKLNTLTFTENAQIEEINLKNSTINSSINFAMLPNLKKLDLTNCTFNMDVTFNNLPSLEQLIMKYTVFNGEVIIQDNVNVTEFDFSSLHLSSISFSGTDLDIKTINFHGTNFENTTININAIVKNIENLYFDSCTGVKHLEITDDTLTFDNIKVFSLVNSSIESLGNNNNNFDCIYLNDKFSQMYLNNSTTLKKVNKYNDNNNVSLINFNFAYTKVKNITNINWNGSCASLFQSCTNLQTITGTLNAITSINRLFFMCYNLTTLPTININNSETNPVETAQEAFLGLYADNEHVSFNTIKSIIQSCKKVKNFAGILRFATFNQNQEINLTELFNNGYTENLTDAFSNLTTVYVTSHPNKLTINNNIILIGRIPSTVKDTSRMFWLVKSVTCDYDILQDAYSLESAEGMFANCTLAFNNNIQNIIYEDNNISVNNLVNKYFFPQPKSENGSIVKSKLKNINSMFETSGIITNDGTLFVDLPDLVSTTACFYSATLRKFEYNIYDENQQITNTVDIDLNVSNMWENNTKIENIAACFGNVYNVWCNNLIFSNDLNNTTDNNEVDISGLFGLSGEGKKNESKNIILDIDSITTTLITNNKYKLIGNIYDDALGTFASRKVVIISNEETIFTHLSGQCKRIFQNATLYINANTTTFNLTNVTNCNYMFNGCRIYKYSADPEHQYVVTDRKFVNITMPTNCAEYIGMFQGSSVLNNLPVLNSPSSSNLSYMYAGCIINQPSVILNADYFQICKTKLTNTSYMFYCNQYLTELQYSENVGLFDGCILLSNVTSMFNTANYLHKGIPVNFFGGENSDNITYLLSLGHMFEETLIIYDISDINKCININTFNKLINLESTEAMFKRTKVHTNSIKENLYGELKLTVQNANNMDVYIVGANTFTYKFINNIKEMFMQSAIDIPFSFLGFENGSYAFFGSNIGEIASNFVPDNNISRIINVNKMFYKTDKSLNKLINNLGTFIDKITSYPNIQKVCVAGNVTNPDIANIYKANNATDDNNDPYGFVLLTASNPEANGRQIEITTTLPKVYGRYDGYLNS